MIRGPWPRLGDRDDASKPSDVLGQQDYEVLTPPRPPQPHIDRCTLKVR